MLGQNLPIILLLLGLFVSPIIASVAGVFRLRSVSGPDRIAKPGTAPQLIGVLIMGFVVWVGSQAAYGAYMQWRFSHQHGAQARITETDFTPTDWAVLSVAPALLAFPVLVLADLSVGGRSLLRSLGVAISQLPKGIVWGAAGAVIVLPLTYLAAAATSIIYDHLHVQHPQAHELLLQMTSASGWVRADLIIGATIVAPLFEELLFRGHFQTLIRRVLLYLTRQPMQSGGVGPSQTEMRSVAHGASAEPLPAPLHEPQPLQYATLPAERVDPPGLWQTWLAILLASMLFTAVHPMWMWPPLFVLAIGLGYAYERTGNLWTSIAMHCAFNSLSTAIYLWSGR
jgi:membrane protease YdiL (CAAX protease family)